MFMSFAHDRLAASCAIVLMAMTSALLGVAPLAAQEGPPVSPISSDRPGLGDGAHVLDNGVWQAELGGNYMGGGDSRFAVGQALVRGGFEAFELRVYGNSLIFDQTSGSSDFGFEDVGVGAKVPVSASGGWSWSALGLLTLPTGSDDYSAREVTGGAAIIGETSLSNSIGLALNAGYFFPFNAVGDGSFTVILTPAFAVPGAPEFTAYAGVASYFGHGADANFVEAGVAYAKDADTQLDLNWGIDTDTRAWFLGVGWAKRWR
jgi:hypothetical protein